MAQRKSWSAEQDDFIRLKVQHNSKVPDKSKLKWGQIAQELNQKFPDSHRSGKQCRQRWHNQLDPLILHSEWSLDEQKKLFELQKKLGNKWAEIASNIKGRTDNNVKNYFYSTLRKSLRKLNTFIALNRAELKAAKEFKQSSLSKLLAVADHKFDKKINIKKVTAQMQAIQIKNMLIQITRTQVTDHKAKVFFMALVKRLQEWNKCCKKKKGKKKPQIQAGQEEEQQISDQDEQQEDNLQEYNNNKISVVQKKISTHKPRMQRSRSRNNRQSMRKKQYIQSQRFSQQRNRKKSKRPQFESKQSSKLQQIPHIIKRQSSKQLSNLSNSNLLEMSRSSLDLGKNQKKPQLLNHSSNLFKSFIIDNNHEQNHENHQKPIQKSPQSKVRITRSSSNFGFLDMIKQVSFQRKQSQKSGLGDFMHQQDYDHLFGMRLLKRQSSRRELPLLKEQSFAGFGALDQSLRFEPQIQKLRSWRKQSSNFEMQYKFENSHLN